MPVPPQIGARCAPSQRSLSAAVWCRHVLHSSAACRTAQSGDRRKKTFRPSGSRPSGRDWQTACAGRGQRCIASPGAPLPVCVCCVAQGGCCVCPHPKRLQRGGETHHRAGGTAQHSTAHTRGTGQHRARRFGEMGMMGEMCTVRRVRWRVRGGCDCASSHCGRGSVALL
jgi:hypothetical protein